jgi:ATP-dependent DNA ligase
MHRKQRSFRTIRRQWLCRSRRRAAHGVEYPGLVAGRFHWQFNPKFSTKAPSSRQWIHEIKHYGYRLIVRKDRQRVPLFTRRI